VLALFATPLWYAWRNTIEQGRTEVLQADAQKMMDLFAKQGADALAAAIDLQVGGQLEDVENIILLLADSTFSKRAGNLPAWPHQVSELTGMHITSIDAGDRVVLAALLHKTLPGGYHLLVGRDIDRFEKLEKLFLYGLLGCGATVLLVAFFGGLLIRRALLSRVHGISQTTSAIVEGDLSRRLPTLNGEDELEMLAHTVNRMLDQIEHLLHSVRNVSNAIAHDLRTPLAELRSRLEELSLTRPSPDETFAEIDTAIADVDRVIAIFNALLRLAEIDSGTRRSGFVEVDVTKVATEVAEFYHPVAELKEIALTFESSGNLVTAGDPLLLAQAIGNLIDNALKYAQHNGVISVEAKRRSDQIIEVVVSDDGPGIPDEEKSKVIERFYRSDASRGTPGVGLGLSLVAAVARLHGGALKLGDNHPGLRAALLLDSHRTSAP
jgi:signal transduction histidine kinase